MCVRGRSVYGDDVMELSIYMRRHSKWPKDREFVTTVGCDTVLCVKSGTFVPP